MGSHHFVRSVRRSLHDELVDGQLTVIQGLVLRANSLAPDAAAYRNDIACYIQMTSLDCRVAELISISEKTVHEPFRSSDAQTLAEYWSGKGLSYPNPCAVRQVWSSSFDICFNLKLVRALLNR